MIRFGNIDFLLYVTSFRLLISTDTLSSLFLINHFFSLCSLPLTYSLDHSIHSFSLLSSLSLYFSLSLNKLTLCLSISLLEYLTCVPHCCTCPLYVTTLVQHKEIPNQSDIAVVLYCQLEVTKKEPQNQMPKKSIVKN